MLSKCIISGIVGIILLTIGIFCFFCRNIGTGLLTIAGSSLFFYDVVEFIKFKKSRKDNHH